MNPHKLENVAFVIVVTSPFVLLVIQYLENVGIL
jgi:hypothetical protein